MRTVRLGEIAKVERTGVDPSTVPDDTWYLGLEHIERGGGIIGRQTAGEAGLASNKFTFTSGHILYGKLRPYLGKIAAPNFSGVCSTDILPVLPYERIDKRYLLHYLRQPGIIGLANTRSSGANLPRLSAGELLKFEVPLPPLHEQRRVAAILDQADALRTKRRTQLAHLDALPQAIYLSMTQDAAVTSTQLGNILTFRSGKFLPTKAQKGGGIPVYGGNGVTGFHHEPMFATPQVVIGRVGAYCGAVHLTSGPAWVTDNALVATPIDPSLNRAYLAAALTSADLNSRKSQSGQPLISGTRIADVMIPLLSSQDQQTYADRVATTQTARGIARQAAQITDALFASLQSRAFRGEL